LSGKEKDSAWEPPAESKSLGAEGSPEVIPRELQAAAIPA
jgi:hypothetical protein